MKIKGLIKSFVYNIGYYSKELEDKASQLMQFSTEEFLYIP